MNAPNEPARAQDGEAARATDGLDLITARIAPQWPWTIRAVAPYVGSPKHLVVTFVHESGEFKPQTMYGTLVDIARRVADDELDKRAVHIDVSTAQLDFEDRNRSAGEYVASPAGDIDITPHAPATPRRSVPEKLDEIRQLYRIVYDSLDNLLKAVTDSDDALAARINDLVTMIRGSGSELGPLGIENRLYDTEVRVKELDAFAAEVSKTIAGGFEVRRLLQDQIDVIARGHADLRRDFRDLERVATSRRRPTITNTWIDADGVERSETIEGRFFGEPETEEPWTQALSLAKAMTEWAAFRDSTDQPAAVLALCQLANALMNQESLRLHRQSVALQTQGVETQARMFDLADAVKEDIVGADLQDTPALAPLASCCHHPAHQWGECGQVVIDERLSPDRRMTVICTCQWDF